MIFALSFLLVIGKSYSSEDTFLRWFDDQFDEIYDSPAILEVEGTIPDYLVGGSLFRVGPSIGHTSKRNYTNFVDFFGRISKWSITSKSEVKFQSALIKSLQYNASNNLTDIPTHITAEKSAPKFRGLVNIDNMDNTNVFMYAFRNDDSNSILTFTDFYQSNDIDILSMRTLGNTKFQDSINPIWSSSHPQEYQDPESDSHDAVLVNWFGTKSIHDAGHMKLSVFKMGKDLTRKPVGSVEVPFLPYSIHSLAVVGDWAIVQVGPVSLGFLQSGLNDCLSCSAKSKLDTDPTRVYVFDLRSSANPDAKPIATFEIPPPHNFFSFHQVNAVNRDVHTEDTSVVELDLCVYRTMDGLLGDFVLGNMQDLSDVSVRDTMPYDCDALRRLSLNVHSGEYSYTDIPIIDVNGNTFRVELMSISPAFAGKPYCFVYAPVKHFAGSPRYEDMGIIKANLCLADGTPDAVTVVGSYSRNSVYVGEPVFVPDPFDDTGDEDAGVLLVVTRGNPSSNSKIKGEGESEGVSHLVVLDARSMQPIASVEAPFSMPYEFHGQFFDYIQ